MNYIIGVDFDNTIISYNNLIYNVALEKGLIASHVEKQKKQIRDHIRLLPDGEKIWQQLQATIYGPRIGEGQLIEGVKDFFKDCYQSGITIYIISHKTPYASFDKKKINLREASLYWMTENDFFDVDHFGLDKSKVFFESTRIEKIERIKNLGCTHFIDDLEETFMEDSFPSDIKKILYTPHGSQLPLSEMTIVTAWKEIHDYFFITH